MDNYEIDASRQPVVIIRDGEVFTNSRDVAAFFGKNHRDVLRAIDNLLKQEPDLGVRNFAQGVYTLPETAEQRHRAFDMDREGFELLAMGFTGLKALQWKRTYVRAFKAMEDELVRQRIALPSSQTDLLAEYVKSTNAEIGAHREMTLKSVDGIKGAVMHYLKVNVLAWMELRFRAMYDRDVMLLTAAGDQRELLKSMDARVSTVVAIARRGMDPEAFIRHEWCDVDDIYRLAGIDKPIPRRGTLSAMVSRALDAYCKASLHQLDMRSWVHAGKPANYWRATTVKLWLKADGLRMIRLHIERNTPPVQGVIPFGTPRVAK